MKLVLIYSSRYAFVDAMMECEDEYVRHRLESTKIRFLAKFCLKGRKILNIGTAGGYPVIEVEEDGLDREVFKVAQHIPATKWSVWMKAIEILEEKGRKEALEYLRTVAISIRLGGG